MRVLYKSNRHTWVLAQYAVIALLIITAIMLIVTPILARDDRDERYERRYYPRDYPRGGHHDGHGGYYDGRGGYYERDGRYYYPGHYYPAPVYPPPPVVESPPPPPPGITLVFPLNF